MGKTLSEDFIRLMHDSYEEDEVSRLCNALCSTDPEISVRLNPHKFPRTLIPDPALLSDPVTWCPDAYYLCQRPTFTFDPLLHAGAYYVQEASSMYLATVYKQYLGASEPISALDLCAAPGGKSTLLAALLPQGSLLVSNEPMPKRAQVLAENMQKWTRMPEGRYPVDSIVTQAYPDAFSALTGCFDLLVTDVPCSGEGMFRKDDGAISDWSLKNVELCWHRQRDILQSVWHTLKPNGLLLYSTCTFNHFEDEDNARWICTVLGGELLEERHFLPGRERGEGFYVAAIRKTTGSDCMQRSPQDIIRLVNSTLTVLFDATTASPLVGEHINLSYDHALQYLRREAIRVDAPRGPLVLCYQGLVLGPGKGVGNRVNNLYPESWRIRTTYTTPFTLAADQ